MERQDKKEPTMQALQNKLQTLSTLVSRANFAAALGQQYSGERDIYQALGYPLNITYSDYNARYQRQDIAKAIIDRPVKVTWEGELSLLEGKDDKETALEKEWTRLNDELKLKSVFTRVDKLAGIGEYAVLVLGLDDVTKAEDFAKEVLPGNKRKLKYVKPFGQEHAVIDTWDENVNSERFGLPLIYKVTITDAQSNTSKDIKVHYTRIIHVIDDILESEVLGIPRLQGVFNRLMDLEKLVGGSAEMFWRGARGGYQGKVDKDFTLTATEQEDLIDQIDEYEHNLRRMLINKGITFESLQQQLADPKSSVDVQIQMISAVTGIPKRILTGSERGELSSSQDKDEWNSYVSRRRGEFAEPRIIRPFVDAGMKYGFLPQLSTEKYDIKWDDLFALSQKDQAEIGRVRATAIKEYTTNPMAEMIIPPDAFMQFILGLKEEEIELIKEQIDNQVRDEPFINPEEEEIIEEELNND